MKKYLLIIGCVCLALSLFADDNDFSISRTGTKRVELETSVIKVHPLGGKPRKPILNIEEIADGFTPTPSSFESSPGTRTGMSNGLVEKDLVSNNWSFFVLDKDPFGGKPRVPVMANGTLIDQLLKAKDDSKSISDLTDQIDQYLTDGSAN